MADNVVTLIQPPAPNTTIAEDFTLLSDLANTGKIRSFICLWIDQNGTIYAPHYMASETDMLALGVVADLELIEKYNSEDE